MRSSGLRGLGLIAGAGLGLAFAVLDGACTANVFACGSSDDCQDGGTPGTCEPTGFCSFPDMQCDSGSRYGDHAGDGLAGECVPSAGTSGVSVGDDATQVGSLEDDTSLDDSSTGMITTISTTMPVEGSTTDEPPVTCGDGKLDPDEACDDANDIDGDGCNDCQLGGEIIWSLVEDGGQDLADGAAAIAIGAGDELFVSAWFTTDTTPVLAARRLTLAGEVEWTTPIEGPNPWDSIFAWGLDIDEGNNPAIAADGNASTGGEWVVAQLTSNGEIDWQTIEPGEAFGLAIGLDVWVCGRTSAGLGRIVSYGADGTEVERLEGTVGHPMDGFAWDIAVDDGTLVLSGSIDTVPEYSYVSRIMPSGAVIDEITLDVAYDEALALAVGLDDIWVVGHSVALTGWMASMSPSLAAIDGPVEVTDPATSPGNLHGVAIGPAGEVVVVGWVTGRGDMVDGLVQKYTAGGELVWERTYDNDIAKPHSLRDAVVASDGTIVVVGHSGGLNAMGDAWMMRLTP